MSSSSEDGVGDVVRRRRLERLAHRARQASRSRDPATAATNSGSTFERRPTTARGTTPMRSRSTPTKIPQTSSRAYQDETPVAALPRRSSPRRATGTTITSRTRKHTSARATAEIRPASSSRSQSYKSPVGTRKQVQATHPSPQRSRSGATMFDNLPDCVECGEPATNNYRCLHCNATIHWFCTADKTNRDTTSRGTGALYCCSECFNNDNGKFVKNRSSIF